MIDDEYLIGLRFKRKWLSDKSGYWFEKSFKHKILGLVVIHTNSDLTTIYLQFYDNSNYFDRSKKLTRKNIDLFIRFAKGEMI